LVDLLDQSSNQTGANRHEPEKLDWRRWGSNRCTTRLKLTKGVMTTASLLLIVINVWFILSVYYFKIPYAKIHNFNWHFNLYFIIFFFITCILSFLEEKKKALLTLTVLSWKGCNILPMMVTKSTNSLTRVSSENSE